MLGGVCAAAPALRAGDAEVSAPAGPPWRRETSAGPGGPRPPARAEAALPAESAFAPKPAGLKDTVPERPYHSNLCTSEFH